MKDVNLLLKNKIVKTPYLPTTGKSLIISTTSRAMVEKHLPKRLCILLVGLEEHSKPAPACTDNGTRSPMHKVPLYNINKNKVLFLWFRWLPPPLCSPVRINKKNIKNGRGSWSQSRPNRFSPKHLYELALTPPKKKWKYRAKGYLTSNTPNLSMWNAQRCI